MCVCEWEYFVTYRKRWEEAPDSRRAWRRDRSRVRRRRVLDPARHVHMQVHRQCTLACLPACLIRDGVTLAEPTVIVGPIVRSINVRSVGCQTTALYDYHLTGAIWCGYQITGHSHDCACTHATPRNYAQITVLHLPDLSSRPPMSCSTHTTETLQQMSPRLRAPRLISSQLRLF